MTPQGKSSSSSSTSSTAGSFMQQEQQPRSSSSSAISEDDWAALLQEECLHDPPPSISRSTVWMTGISVFALSVVRWPPIILLLVTYFLSVLLPYSFRINDDASARRQLLDRFEKEDRLSDSLRELADNVHIENGYWTHSRGGLMYYTILTPTKDPVRAVLCHCHGYLDTPTFTKRQQLSYMAQQGIAVVMVDYEGHGRSDGTLGLIVDWNVLVQDVHSFFQHTTTTTTMTTQSNSSSGSKLRDRKVFLMGESMGGAVAYSIIQAHPDCYAGVNFVAPMCKIAAEMLPPSWVIDVGRYIAGPTGTCTALGYLPISPTKGDLKFFTFKLAHKRALATRVPSIFARKPRMATARELLNATQSISSSLGTFQAPFLVQHGKADRVTDPKLSQALYEESPSHDKTIKLYEGMWHSLTAGEPEENSALVLNDSIEWILERAGPLVDTKKIK